MKANTNTNKDTNVKATRSGQTLGKRIEQVIRSQIFLEVQTPGAPYGYWYNTIKTYILQARRKATVPNTPAYQALEKILETAMDTPGVRNAIDACLLFYTDTKLMTAYLDSLSVIERSFLARLVWYGAQPYEMAAAHFNQALLLPDPKRSTCVTLAPGFEHWGGYLRTSVFYYQLSADGHQYYDLAESSEADHYYLDYLQSYDTDDLDEVIEPYQQAYKDDYYAFGDGSYYDYEYHDGYGDKVDVDDDNNDDDGEEEEDIDSQVFNFKLPLFIYLALRQVADKPRDYTFNSITLPDDYTRYSGEAVIFEELPVILNACQDGTIKRNPDGNISRVPLPKLQQQFSLRSFPNDPGYIKLLCIAGNLIDVKTYTFSTQQVIKKIKAIFNRREHDFASFNAVLFPIHNFEQATVPIWRPDDQTVIISAISKFPENEWVTLDNILAYFQVHGLYQKMGTHFGEEELDEETIEPALYPQTGGLISQADFDHRVLKSTIRRLIITGQLVMAAAFGVIELAYDPKDKRLQFDANKQMMHDCGFTACRLTPLGSVIFGSKKDYEAPEIIKESLFSLDPDRLEITVKIPSAVTAGLLEAWTIASPYDPSLLLFSWDKIYDNNPNQYALIYTLQEFWRTIDVPLPLFWQRAFAVQLQKIDSLVAIGDVVIYKISPHDKRLQQLLTQDQHLSKQILRAEDYTIIIPAAHQWELLMQLRQWNYVPDTESDEEQGDNDEVKISKRTQFRPRPDSNDKIIQDFDDYFK